MNSNQIVLACSPCTFTVAIDLPDTLFFRRNTMLMRRNRKLKGINVSRETIGGKKRHTVSNSVTV